MVHIKKKSKKKKKKQNLKNRKTKRKDTGGKLIEIVFINYIK